MIRKVLSKLPDSAAVKDTMSYALDKAELVDGSEPKFDGTSVKDYIKLGVKKFSQVNNKFEPKTGRKQEVQAIHEVISFSAKDNLTNEQALEIALSVWKEAIDLDNRKYRVAVHDKDDNGKTHVHLIWNKRDNKGKPYEQKNDYELFEKLCHQAELKHGLEEVKNRKYLNPKMPTNPQGPNEYRLENRGIKSEKSKFKEAVTSATDKAMTAGEFLEFLHADGFTLITNGNNAYSIEKDGVIFKASEIGASYKLLKARFGDDPQFGDTLARLGVKTAPVREMGSIGGDFHDQQSEITERRIKKSNRVVDTRFDTPDGHDFFFKNSTTKAFEYSATKGKATFNTNSPMAIKAGLQKLTESGKPHTLHLNGTETFKRQAWLQFHMMNLDKKGYSLKGYKATEKDKAELEKMKLENPAFKKPIQDNNIKALPADKPADKSQENPQIKNGAGNLANKTKQLATTAVQVGTGLAMNSGLMAGVDILTSSDQVYQIDQLAAKIKADYEAEENARQSARTASKRSRGMKFTPK